MTLVPSGSQGPGSPWRTTVAQAAGVATTAASVSVSAAAARAAASCGVHGGQRRVFTRPGTGAFTRTRIRPRYEPLAPEGNGQWTIGSGRTHPADNSQILGDRGVHVVGIGLPVDHLLVLGAEVSPDPEVLQPLFH